MGRVLGCNGRPCCRTVGMAALLAAVGCHGGDFGPHGSVETAGASSCVAAAGSAVPAAPFEVDEHTIALWHLDGTTGGVAEDVGVNGLDGDIHGATAIDGYIDGALSFDGEDDFVRIPRHDALFPAEQITIEALVLPIGEEGGWFYDVQNTSSLGVMPTEDGLEARLHVRVDQELVAVFAGEPLAANEWHHVAGCFDGQTARLWVDGRQVATRESPGSLTPSSELYPDQCETPAVGSTCRADQGFLHAKIDEVRVSDVCRYGGGVPAWTAQGESSAGGWSSSSSVVAMQDGGIAVTGAFSGTTSFGRTAAELVTLDSRQPHESFVARWSGDGTPSWVVPLGGAEDPTLARQAVAASADGTVTVTGSFAGTASFGAAEDPNLQRHTADGNSSLFVSRLSDDGRLAWLSLGLSAVEARGDAVAAAQDGSAVVVGGFKGTVELGTGSAAVQLTSAGGTDGLVARYGGAGELAWARRIGSPHLERPEAVTLLADGTTVVAGYFMGPTLTLAPGHADAVTLTRDGFRNCFLAWLDSDGGIERVAQVRGHCRARSIDASPDGAVLLGGVFEEPLVFDAGMPTELTLTPEARTDGFVASYRADGSLAWGRAISGPSDVHVTSVASSAGSGMLVAGGIFGEPSAARASAGQPDEQTIDGPCSAAAFYGRYAADGRLVWTRWIAADDVVHLEGIVGTAGGLWLCGSLRGNAHFGPELPEPNLASAADLSMFLTRASP